MSDLQRHEPRDLVDHLALLDKLGLNASIDRALANLIRVLSGAKVNGICLCSGGEALPYASWMLDGMLMSGRLIAHLEPEQSDFEQAVVRLVDLDIRVAGHVQKLNVFCHDISHHQLDLVIGAFELDEIHLLLKLLGSDGLLIVLGQPDHQRQVFSEFQELCFFSPVGNDGRATLMTPRGLQHQVKRAGRRGRRARL